MPEVKGVQFIKGGLVHNYYPGKDQDKLHLYDYCVVETEHGLQVGKVIHPAKHVSKQHLPDKLKPILRHATEKDHEQFAQNEEKEKEGINLLQQSEFYMERLRGNQISMIFQEPNAALNPILSINDQISESFLIHQRDKMCDTIIAELKEEINTSPSPLKKYQLVLFERQAQNPNDIVVKLFSKIPVLKSWNRRLYKEATKRSIDIVSKLII